MRLWYGFLFGGLAFKAFIMACKSDPTRCPYWCEFQAEVLELEEERNILDKVVPGDLRTLFQCACPETPTGEGHTDTIKHHTKAPNPPPKKKGSAFPSS